MRKCIHSLCLYVLWFNCLLYISTIVMFVIIIKDYFGEEKYLHKMIIDFGFIVSYIIMVINTILFGVYGVFFAIVLRLTIYSIVSSVFSLIMISFSIVCLIKSIWIMDKFDEIDLTCFVINCVSILSTIITIALTIIERHSLLKQLSNTPLSQIDDKLSEELYKNILSQSINPNDKKLEEEYVRLSIKHRENINSANSSQDNIEQRNDANNTE